MLAPLNRITRANVRNEKSNLFLEQPTLLLYTELRYDFVSLREKILSYPVCVSQ